jgi:hypothetical protein
METKREASTSKKKASKRNRRRSGPLTDLQVQALAPRSKRYTVRDSGSKGLFLDVTPGGVKSWIFRYQFNGEQEKYTIGRYPEFGLKDAREKRDALAVDVSRGTSPAEVKKSLRAEAASPSAGNPTVRDFGGRYLKEVVEKNWKDASNERRYLEKDFFPGKEPIVELLNFV